MMTLRQRAFIKAMAEGARGPEAAIAAGYRPKSARACALRLLRRREISAALDHARLVRRDFIDQVDEVRKLAIEHGDAASAVRALELKARLEGRIA